ncbi:MAG: hypothetical protein ACLFTK_05150, partial [Anaerolineales bacterium]
RIGHGPLEAQRARAVWRKPLVIEEMGPVGGKGRGDAAGWVSRALDEWFGLGVAGCMQWAFSATDGNIGVGDFDSGMHKGPANDDQLPTHDWDALFNVYRRWGQQFWVS